jgi:hypothetical protein
MLTPGNICHDFVLAKKMIRKVHINDVHGIIIGIGCAKEQGTKKKEVSISNNNKQNKQTSKTSKQAKQRGGLKIYVSTMKPDDKY